MSSPNDLIETIVNALADAIFGKIEARLQQCIDERIEECDFQGKLKDAILDSSALEDKITDGVKDFIENRVSIHLET
jgi:hypothetical protein